MAKKVDLWCLVTITEKNKISFITTLIKRKIEHNTCLILNKKSVTYWMLLKENPKFKWAPLQMDSGTWVYNLELKNKKRKQKSWRLLMILLKWSGLTKISFKEKMLSIFKLLCFNYWAIKIKKLVKLQKNKEKQIKRSVKELVPLMILKALKKEGNEKNKRSIIIIIISIETEGRWW